MKKRILLPILFLTAHLVFCQWESKNPGAGGQVQDIICDPNQDQRLILASDMEGIYESTNNGNTWNHKGKLHQNRVYAVAIPKSNNHTQKNKMFVGTLYGLEVSNNRGQDFTLIPNTKKISIGAIAVHPSNPSIVLAGIGWKDDYDFIQKFGLSPDKSGKGKGEIFRTNNGGISWSKIEFNSISTTDRNVYTIQFDPTNGNNVYMASSKGLYKSTNAGTSWTLINGPNNGKCRGVAIDPDGSKIYAVFTTNGNKGHVYTKAVSASNWTQVSNGMANEWDFWYPEVDPRSSTNQHKVLIAMQGDRQGLYEGTFNWSGNTLATHSWSLKWNGTSGYDTGWDKASPKARIAHYTPESWPRAVWSTSDQTMFRGTPNGNNYNWLNKYSNPNNAFNVNGDPTYSSKGTASTFTYDVAKESNYVLQCMADNGWVESWDSGTSWSNRQMRDMGNISDIQAADIAFDNGKSIVVSVGSKECYGGICSKEWYPSYIYVKELNTKSPSDQWVRVNNSDKVIQNYWYANEGRYREVAVSPAKKDRVFFGVNEDGIYMVDNVSELLDGTADNLIKIGGATTDKFWIRTITPHPTNPDIVYVTNTNGPKDHGLWQGTKSGSNWNFVKLLDGKGSHAEVSVWIHNGQTRIFYVAKTDNNSPYVGRLKLGNGNWNTVITPTTNAVLNNNPYWESIVGSDFRFENFGGIIGTENTLVTNYYDHNMQLSHGIYRGSIDSNGAVNWVNWSGNNLYFGGATTMKLDGDGSNRKLYMSTPGAGLLVRDFDNGGSSNVDVTGVNINGCNSGSSLAIGATRNLDTTISPSNATNQNVTWSSSNSNIATVDSSGLVTAVLQGSANITVTTNNGNKTATCTIAVSGGGNNCNNDNLVTNGEFDNGISDWTFYNNTSGNHSKSVVSNAGLSGTSAAKITLNSAAGSNDSDIQFYRNTGNLLNGKTYEITFKAKASGNRTMRVGVLSNLSPWTNFSSDIVNLTTSAQDFGPLEFTMNTNASNVRLDFFLGGNSQDVFIDKIEIKEKCSENPSPIIPTSISINGCTNSDLPLGSTRNLDEVVLPINATDKSVVWTSSNPSVATVNSSNGLVTGISQGSAVITATTNSGNKIANCTVNVFTQTNGNVTVRARLIGAGSDQLQFRVNDVTVKTWTVSGSNFADYTAQLSVNGNVKTYFPDNGTDMEIDYIIINGTTYQAENQSINTATWQNGSCGGSNSSMLYCEGYIDFGTLTTGGSGSTTAYRYLRLTGFGTVGNEVTLQRIQWMKNSNSYPNPEINWNTQSQVTSSNNNSSDYAAYENTNSGWQVGTSYPAWIKIDLGSGNELSPDEIIIKANASNRGFSAFECHGSNDDSSWTLLHSESGLTSSDYPSTIGVFNFGGSGMRTSISPNHVYKLSEEINIYPNPLNHGDDINIRSISKKPFELRIYDINGRLVFQNKYFDLKSEHITINTKSKFGAGLYFVKYVSESIEVHRKLIIN